MFTLSRGSTKMPPSSCMQGHGTAMRSSKGDSCILYLVSALGIAFAQGASCWLPQRAKLLTCKFQFSIQLHVCCDMHGDGNHWMHQIPSKRGPPAPAAAQL